MAPSGHCFVSYSSHDAELASWLVDGLRRHGIVTWRDRDAIRLGQRARAAVLRAIEASTAAVLVLTEHALDSPWVAAEIYHLRRRGVPVLAARMRSCAVPEWALGACIIDFRGDSRGAMASLVARLTTLPAPTPKTQSSPR